MKTPTVSQFIDQIELAKPIDLYIGNRTAFDQLAELYEIISYFDNFAIEAVKIEILQPEKEIFDLLGLPYEGSQLKEFSFPLLRERYQGQVEDSVIVRVIFIH